MFESTAEKTEKKVNVKDMTVIALVTAVICIIAPFSIPIAISPTTLSVLFGSTEALQAVLTPLSAASLLVFCLLYTPCVAAIASIRRAITVVVTQCVLAWLFAFLIRIPFLF